MTIEGMDPVWPGWASHTMAGGRFSVGQPLSGYDRVWEGTDRKSGKNDVLIARTLMHFTKEAAQWLQFEGDGLAPVLFLGEPDGCGRPKKPTHRGWLVAMVCARPAGTPLFQLPRLEFIDILRVGINLCDTVASWWSQSPVRLNRGLRPDTLWIAGPQRRRYSAGCAPELLPFASARGLSPEMAVSSYAPPCASNTIDVHIDETVFTVGLILWYAALHEHAYHFPEKPNATEDNMWKDIRRPFTGDRAIGRLLEQVLVADVAKRMKIDELRHELVALAGARNIELPPFPPPGLAVRGEPS